MSIWSTRRARALVLREEAPHAGEILTAYAALSKIQERVAERTPLARWLATAREAAASGPRVRLERLPPDELVPLFEGFLEGARDVGTAVMSGEAQRLARASADERREELAGALSTWPADGAAPPFHARAFLEAVATALVAALPARAEPAAYHGSACPACGGRPVVATLRDLAGALGTRALVCARCGTEGRIPRLTCAHCGETAAERLGVHSAESVPHVRVDECRTCRRYIKTVDLRRQGDAIPLVDELATLELDLWARDQGLTKTHPNVFGL